MSAPLALQAPGGRPADVLFRRRLTAAVGLAMLVLLGASVATVFLVSQAQDATNWVNHTYQTQHVVSDMRVALARDESSRRGYLITRDPFYMSAYRRSSTELPQLMERFEALTSDNPRQQAAAAQLRPLLQRKLNEQEESLRTITSDTRGVVVFTFRPRCF